MPEFASFTLAIPYFNAAAFIGAALESVDNQTYPPEEIIVVDDGSTDESMDIVKRFPQVRVISHSRNYGIAAARNTAWENATGDIVAFIDADTTVHPRLLETLAGCYCASDIAGAGGRAIEMIQNNRYDRWRKEVLFQDWGENYSLNAHFLFGICSSYRKNILNKLGGFDTFFKVSGEDMDFSFRVNQAGFRLVYHPDAIVYHLRADDRRSIEKMTYRHCYGGFLAQRKNRYFRNKMPLIRSMSLFLKQVFLTGIASGDIAFAFLSIALHFTVFRAWIDSQQKYALQRSGSSRQQRRLLWEGHKDASND